MASVTSSAGTRDRLLTAANELFRAQGFNGTSLSQIVKASKATTGSLYHFFPGGKDELTAEVLRTSGVAYGNLVELVVRAAADPATGLDDAFAGAAELMLGTDFIDPCPIGTIAREVASTHEPLRRVALGVMESWIEIFVAILIEAGVSNASSKRLAILTIASIEGAFVVARTMRDVAPFLEVGHALRDAIAAELPNG